MGAGDDTGGLERREIAAGGGLAHAEEVADLPEREVLPPGQEARDPLAPGLHDVIGNPHGYE
jgi:hypothetical protein